jgi:hypothetical protein
MGKDDTLKNRIAVSIILGIAVVISSFIVFSKEANAIGTGYPVTVVSPVGNIADPTNHSLLFKIFFDGTNWWSFYRKATATSSLFYSSSSNLLNWTETSTTLGGTPSIQGGTNSVLFDPATNVVLVSYYTNTNNDRYLRGVINATGTITWGSSTAVYADTVAKNAVGGYSYGLVKNASSTVLYFEPENYANPRVLISTSTISKTFSDSAAAWANLSGTAASCYVTDYLTNHTVIPLDKARRFFIFTDDLVSGNAMISYYLYNYANCSGAGYTDLWLTSLSGRSSWGVTKLSNTDVRALGQYTASSLIYKTWNGTTWTTSTAPSWPTGGLATSSQVVFHNDSGNLYVFVVRGDVNSTVSYNVLPSGTSTWTGWYDMTTTSAKRSYLTAAPQVAGGKFVVEWTENAGTTSTRIMVDWLYAVGNEGSYRFFGNQDSTQVAPSYTSDQNASTTELKGTPFRLRLLLHNQDLSQSPGSAGYKLQFATSTAGNCTSTLSNFVDIATSSGAIRFYDNPSAADDAALTATSTDPNDSYPVVNQTYQESNPFSVTSTVAAGSDGKWDFSLIESTSTAATSTTYCFRAVNADGSPLSAYNAIPEIKSDTAPTVDSITLNGFQDITLIEGTTKVIVATTTVSDIDGLADLAPANGIAYLSSIGPGCSPNENNCYATSSCPLSGCSGNSCMATCSFVFNFDADPTDANTPWSGQYWAAQIQAVDDRNASTTATSTGVSLLSMIGVQISLGASSLIDYGGLQAGSTTNPLSAWNMIFNTGNISMDMTMYGTDLTTSSLSIPVGQQRYATGTVPYTSGTALTASPGVLWQLNMPKTTDYNNAASTTVYWGIKVPTPQSTGYYYGTNSFIGVKNALPWP